MKIEGNVSMISNAFALPPRIHNSTNTAKIFSDPLLSHWLIHPARENRNVHVWSLAISDVVDILAGNRLLG